MDVDIRYLTPEGWKHLVAAVVVADAIRPGMAAGLEFLLDVAHPSVIVVSEDANVKSLLSLIRIQTGLELAKMEMDEDEET